MCTTSSRDGHTAATVRQQTPRGFPGPEGTIAEGDQRVEKLYVVRLTLHERKLLRADRSGVAGRFCLMDCNDGTYELVRYSDG